MQKYRTPYYTVGVVDALVGTSMYRRPFRSRGEQSTNHTAAEPKTAHQAAADASATAVLKNT